MEQDKTVQNEPVISSSQSNYFQEHIYKPALTVIFEPARFYASVMPKSGGFARPLIFMMVIAAVTALVMSLLAMAGFGSVAMLTMGTVGVITLPLLVAVFGFVGAAIVFLIWKLMGSDENFETAYRSVAYSYAYAPVAVLIAGIPFLGAFVSSFWPMTLLAIASIHVHGCDKNASWGVFGGLGLLTFLMTV